MRIFLFSLIRSVHCGFTLIIRHYVFRVHFLSLVYVKCFNISFSNSSYFSRNARMFMHVLIPTVENVTVRECVGDVYIGTK